MACATTPRYTSVMPLFSYTARDTQGKHVQGTVDAVSLQAARAALINMRLQPEELHEIHPIPETPPPPTDPEPDTPFPTEPAVPSWTVEEKPSEKISKEPIQPTPSETSKVYFSLVDTLRLYAGWLLTGYFVAYILGGYQYTKPLPFHIPYVLAFLTSPLILSFSLAAYLFLLFTGIKRGMKGGMLNTMLLTVVAVCIFVVYRINTP